MEIIPTREARFSRLHLCPPPLHLFLSLQEDPPSVLLISFRMDTNDRRRRRISNFAFSPMVILGPANDPTVFD